MMSWNGPQFNTDITKFKFPNLEDLKRQLRTTNTFNIASNIEKKQYKIFHHHPIEFLISINFGLWIKLMTGINAVR